MLERPDLETGGRMRDLILLRPLRVLDDLVLLMFRVLVGGFLVHGVLDNVSSAERMAEFVGFLGAHGFAAPDLLGPLSVYAQMGSGLAFILGELTRWAGLVCAFNFAVALVMVDAEQGVRAAFPSAALMVFGLYMATHGAGRWAVDAWVGERRREGISARFSGGRPLLARGKREQQRGASRH